MIFAWVVPQAVQKRPFCLRKRAILWFLSGLWGLLIILLVLLCFGSCCCLAADILFFFALVVNESIYVVCCCRASYLSSSFEVVINFFVMLWFHTLFVVSWFSMLSGCCSCWNSSLMRLFVLLVDLGLNQWLFWQAMAKFAPQMGDPHGDPQTSPQHADPHGFLVWSSLKRKKSMWIGVLRVAMWIAHVGGKFRHGLPLIKTSLLSVALSLSAFDSVLDLAVVSRLHEALTLSFLSWLLFDYGYQRCASVFLANFPVPRAPLYMSKICPIWHVSVRCLLAPEDTTPKPLFLLLTYLVTSENAEKCQFSCSLKTMFSVFGPKKKTL